MVKYCSLCRAEAVKGIRGRSFHRFPAPQYLREKWCQILEKDIKSLSTWTFICSDHFSPDCFIYRSNGQRFLNDDALPRPFTGKVHFREKRKKKSKKLPLKIDLNTIKTECKEQELLNQLLDRDVRVEAVCIKTESNKTDEAFFKIEDIPVKCEPPEEINDKSEETFESYHFGDEMKDTNEEMFETSEMDVEVQSEDTSELDVDESEEIRQTVISPELIKSFMSFSNCQNEDLIPKLFKFIYPKVSKKGDQYSCTECSLQTTDRNTLRRHFVGHRDVEYKKHPELYKDYQTYRCTLCDYVSIQKFNLSRHMVKHLPKDGTVVKTFVCDECEYTTKYRCDIVKHRSKHVPPDFRFFCTKCSYKAYEESNLKKHMEKGHLANKQYRYDCEQCPFKTDSKGGLSRHIRDSHSNNKPFKYECTYCSFKNDSKGSLNLHMKLGHTGLVGLSPASK